jgi:hypothetical protein
MGRRQLRLILAIFKLRHYPCLRSVDVGWQRDPMAIWLVQAGRYVLEHLN